MALNAGEIDSICIPECVGEYILNAVTGDLPPVDYIAPDGTPAGYNTAVLAELGRRLHVNIEPVQVDAGARAAALTSGRVDCVFWFADAEGMNAKYDLPEGIILTTPYLY